MGEINRLEPRTLAALASGVGRPMEALGYVFRADNPELTKRYFREAPGTRRTHIHVRRAGSWNERSPRR